MLSSSFKGSTRPNHIYPRLQALSHRGSSAGITRPQFQPVTVLDSPKTGSNPHPRWTRHFHKRPTSQTTLSYLEPSSPYSDSPVCPIHTRTMAPSQDPVARTASPYTDPKVQGPRAQILSSGIQSDLRKSTFTHLLPLPSLLCLNGADVCLQCLLTPSTKPASTLVVCSKSRPVILCSELNTRLTDFLSRPHREHTELGMILAASPVCLASDRPIYRGQAG